MRSGVYDCLAGDLLMLSFLALLESFIVGAVHAGMCERAHLGAGRPVRADSRGLPALPDGANSTWALSS